MHACIRCEALPDEYPANGVLYIAPPIVPSVLNLRHHLQERGIEHTEPLDHLFAIPLHGALLMDLCHGYFRTLGMLELQDTKTLLKATGTELGMSDLLRMQPLSQLVARMQGQWLINLLHDDRLTTFFQPIVFCAEPQRIFGYECLLRATDEHGGLISPATMFEVARKGDLLFYLDRAARLSAIHGARRHAIHGKIFINFNPTSIYNPDYCLQTTLQAIRGQGLDRAQIVFEVVESDTVSDVEHLVKVMNFYRAEGFGVALDDLGAGYGSLNLLHKLRPDYIKLDMELIRGVHADPYKASIAANLLQLARELDITSLAEGVETPQELAWCAQHGANLAQGFLFGRPAAEPAGSTQA